MCDSAAAGGMAQAQGVLPHLALGTAGRHCADDAHGYRICQNAHAVAVAHSRFACQLCSGDFRGNAHTVMVMQPCAALLWVHAKHAGPNAKQGGRHNSQYNNHNGVMQDEKAQCPYAQAGLRHILEYTAECSTCKPIGSRCTGGSCTRQKHASPAQQCCPWVICHNRAAA